MYEFDETGICKQLQIRLCFGTAILIKYFNQEIVSDGCALLVQLVGLAEQDVAHTQQENQGGDGDVLIL